MTSKALAAKKQTFPLDQGLEKQLQFALFKIQDMQDMMRRADSKARFVLGASGVLVSVMVAFASNMKSIFLQDAALIIVIESGLLIGFTISIFVSIIHAFLIVNPFTPSLSTQKSQLDLPALLYYRKIVQIHKTPAEYCQALFDSSPRELVRNAGLEIYALSLGAIKKYDFLKLSIKWLIASFTFWALILSITMLWSP
jgi:hypothetical protein